MKIYKVLIDHDSPSGSGLERVEEHFGANSIGEVFNAAIQRAAMLDGEIVAVVILSDSVTIISQ